MLRHFGTAELSTFDVLRGPTRPLPTGLQSELSQFRYQKARTLWFNTARYVPSDNNGFWVVNGKGVTCIIQNGNGGLACTDKPTLFRTGVAIGYVKLDRPFGKAQEFVVWGLAPDWARTAILKVHHKDRPIAIHDNAYSFRSRSPVIVRRLERRNVSTIGAGREPKQ
jgi:hypothetical protein